MSLRLVRGLPPAIDRREPDVILQLTEEALRTVRIRPDLPHS